MPSFRSMIARVVAFLSCHPAYKRRGNVAIGVIALALLIGIGRVPRGRRWPVRPASLMLGMTARTQIGNGVFAGYSTGIASGELRYEGGASRSTDWLTS